MAGPSFTQSTSDPALYWLAGPDLPAEYGIGLLLPAGSTAPATLDLTQSWTQYRGLYVMTGRRPIAEQTFVAGLRELELTMGNLLRFAWIADATAPAARWQAQVIQVDQDAGVDVGTIAVPAQLAFGSYRLGLAAGLAMGTTDSGFSLSDGGVWAFSLRTSRSVWTLSAPQAGAPPTILSFAGAAAGCIALDLALPQDHEGSGIDDYARLDTGFRFAVDDPAAPEPGLLLSLRYPAFVRVPAGGVSFHGLFDPALTLVAGRTRLAYADGAPAHASHYRSHLGYPVVLTPATQAGDSLPAGLAFHCRPESLHALPSDDPLYLGPIGTFTLGVEGEAPTPGGPAARLGCGLAGTEYFGLSAQDGALVSFSPGEKAYAPSSSAPGNGGPPPALTDIATSPWAAVRPGSGRQVWYYAQPNQGALYRVRDSGTGDSSLAPYLVFLELAAGGIGSAPQAYPMVPYAGISAAALGPYRELEARVLSPTRRAAIETTPMVETKETTMAATPQGLLARFEAEQTTWNLLSFAPLPAPPTPPSLALNDLGDTFRQALQTDQLFLVAANGDLFGGESQLNYWITDAALNDLRALPDSERPPETVLHTLQNQARTPQVGRKAFEAMLQGLNILSQYIPIIVQYAVYFEIVIGSWRFRLSPVLWSRQPAAPTIMIMKFAGSSLRSLVERTTAWTWPEAGEIGGKTSTTQKLILDIIDAAAAQVTAAGTQAHPLDFFVRTVCEDPAWTGVVFLNAQVPFGSMPEELRGLAAGIDANQFRAHHVGLSVTPVEVHLPTEPGDSPLTLGANSFFGLIDYESPDDIAHTFADFDFKVLQLRVLFRNSAVADFSGRIELFVKRLFDDDVTLANSEHYNNLILLGSYQRQRGTGQYVFATGAANLYTCSGAVLESVEITRAQFTTAAGTPTEEDKVRARFMLWGRLRFRQLTGFDLFSFGYTLNRQGGNADDGYLAFSGLAVDMEFLPSNPTARTFAFDVADGAFDLSASIARPTSLFARFPLKLQKVIRGEAGQTPKDLGYQGVETPLYQPTLSSGWYALTFTLDLGTLGALAASAGLVVTLLAAWSSAQGTPEVNVGLQLPGAQALKSLPAIEGVLQSGFQSITIDANGATDWPPNPAYVMRFRQFFLRLLTWRFPPGQVDVYLFGDPEAGPQQSGALGWYAAYVKEQS